MLHTIRYKKIIVAKIHYLNIFFTFLQIVWCSVLNSIIHLCKATNIRNGACVKLTIPSLIDLRGSKQNLSQ